ncbi:MAG TPA: glycosyltransferase family 4 protein [Candidatus Saccharimonadia bacterium]|nr:glycosyltransferase family 4 protein [Candidatus Saccharimonadia bacterium]
MRVLVLQSELGVLRGGGDNFTRNLFTAFAERGHRVMAAFVADRRRRYPLPLPPNIEPIPMSGWWSSNLGQATLSSVSRYIPWESRFGTQWGRVQEALAWRTFAWHSRRFQRRIEYEFARRWDDFDAVYVHGDTILASNVARYRPTVLRLPGPVTAELAPVLRAVPAVCANGDALARIRIFLGDHAIELPIGLDERRFVPGLASVRSALGWTEQHQVVGYVGRLSHLKGGDLLATAFHELSQSAVNARLLIVGSGKASRHMHTVLAQELANGIAHFEQDVDHERLPEWYRAMDVMVMPSRYENFSNAILEAMACGVPCLASAIGGNRMLAETGTGWLFEPNSVSALRACLQSVLENRPEIKTRGHIASRYVRGRYSWAASAERLEWIIASRLGVQE